MRHGSFILVTLLLFPFLLAQDEPSDEEPEPLYRFQFFLSTVDGQERQTRQFTILLEEEDEGMVRALTRTPVGYDEGEPEYVETGLKCDAEYQEDDGLVYLDVEIHYSRFVPSQDTLETNAAERAVQEWQCRVEATLTSGNRTQLSVTEAAADSPGYELEVLAEKIR